MPMVPPTPRRATRYKQPHGFNFVSLLLLAALAAAAYVASAIVPAVLLRGRVVGEIQDMLPRLHRANLRTDWNYNRDHHEIRAEMLERIRLAGVKGAPKVTLEASQKSVSIQVEFIATAAFPWLDKELDIPFAPRAETSAERVQW